MVNMGHDQLQPVVLARPVQQVEERHRVRSTRDCDEVLPRREAQAIEVREEWFEQWHASKLSRMDP